MRARPPEEFGILARISPPFKQRLYFVAVLTKHLKPEGIEPIVSGGHALEFHTLGSYATGDIDLISPGYRIVDRLLRSWGFQKIGRHWLYPDLDIEVEVPASFPEDVDRTRLTRVTIRGLRVVIVGVEDLILDRFNARVHWRSVRDGE